jgi:predicted nucleotidyltransferase
MDQKESYLDELPEITRRIRQVSDPDKIILFGSYARGEAGQHSDMDLMVIKDSMASVLAETKKIYRALANLAVPIDIVVVSQEYLEQ